MNESPRKIAGRAVRYGLAGVFATLVYFASVFALVEWARLAAVPAAAAATVIVMLTSYVVNRAWVFDTTRSHTSALPRFAIATGLSLVLNTGLMHLAVQTFGWPYWGGLLLATAIVPPVNFVVNYFWSFEQQSRG